MRNLGDFDLAEDRREQAGLAATVAADHTHAPTGMQGNIDLGQQQALATPEREVAKGDHDSGIREGNASASTTGVPAQPGETGRALYVIRPGRSLNHAPPLWRFHNPLDRAFDFNREARPEAGLAIFVVGYCLGRG
jgi:hypothetical protein